MKYQGVCIAVEDVNRSNMFVFDEWHIASTYLAGYICFDFCHLSFDYCKRKWRLT